MTCCIDGCDSPIKVKSRRLCQGHYLRFLRFGDPNHPYKRKTKRGEPQKFYDEIFENEQEACLLWPFFRTPQGYAGMNINNKCHSVSRLVCEKTHGPAPFKKAHAAHSCGNGNLGCVNKKHIRWLSHGDNIRERSIHGTDNQGERHGMSKLTEKDVRFIRSALAEDLDLEIKTLLRFEIAVKFGILERSVRVIRDRVSWKHIND